MGVFRDPITINNVGAVGSTTNPLTGSALGMDRENQKAIKELIGTLDWESLSILDGGITPVSSEIIVDTEDGTPADDLTTINLTSDGTTSLHTGMRIKIKSADPSRVITVKHLTGGGNIRTADGQDVVLSNDWSLDLKLQNGEWVEQKGRGYAMAIGTANQLVTKADKTTQVIAGTGLTGGGTLAANRTLEVSYGTAAGTAAQGNDSRITGALQRSQVVQATGTSTTTVMSQKAVTDALGQPSMTGSAALVGATNNTVQLTNIVTTLGLEVGDVIRIQYSGYNKLHTVEHIANNNLIRVNYEHAGNRGNGSLKLADTTASATVTRIAKWYNAPIGMGQAVIRLDVPTLRPLNVWHKNTTGRTILVTVPSYPGSTKISYDDGVTSTDVGRVSSDSGQSPADVLVANGASYLNKAYGNSYGGWMEMR